MSDCFRKILMLFRHISLCMDQACDDFNIQYSAILPKLKMAVSKE